MDKHLNIKYVLYPVPTKADSAAVKYWFEEQNFSLLIKLMFGNREFFVGDDFDFYSLQTLFVCDERGEEAFARDFAKDFEPLIRITRKSYSALANKEGGQAIFLTYEVELYAY